MARKSSAQDSDVGHLHEVARVRLPWGVIRGWRRRELDDVAGEVSSDANPVAVARNGLVVAVEGVANATPGSCEAHDQIDSVQANSVKRKGNTREN